MDSKKINASSRPGRCYGHDSIGRSGQYGGLDVLHDLPMRPPSIKVLLQDLPARVPRDIAAALVTRYFFRVSKRSLERWPVSVRLLNGRAHVETAELFDVAQRIIDQAPRIRVAGCIATAD